MGLNPNQNWIDNDDEMALLQRPIRSLVFTLQNSFQHAIFESEGSD